MKTAEVFVSSIAKLWESTPDGLAARRSRAEQAAADMSLATASGVDAGFGFGYKPASV